MKQIRSHPAVAVLSQAILLKKRLFAFRISLKQINIAFPYIGLFDTQWELAEHGIVFRAYKESPRYKIGEK